MLPQPRRDHPRYPIHRIVSYHYRRRSVLTLTLDLGLGGMKIKTQAPLPKNECFRFKLVLGSDSVWPMGRIAYSRLLSDQQVVSGVHFMELSQADLISLKRYLATLDVDSPDYPRASETSSEALS
jgi:hypothetical protein